MAEYGQIGGRKSTQVGQMSVLAFLYWRVINVFTVEEAARTETEVVTRDILEDGEIRVHTFLSMEAKKNHQRQIHSFGTK